MLSEKASVNRSYIPKREGNYYLADVCWLPEKSAYACSKSIDGEVF